MALPQQAFLFRGEVMIIGISGATPARAHLALQITAGLRASVHVDLGNGAMTETDAFLCATTEPHRIASHGPRAALLIDPSVRAGQPP